MKARACKSGFAHNAGADFEATQSRVGGVKKYRTLTPETDRLVRFLCAQVLEGGVLPPRGQKRMPRMRRLMRDALGQAPHRPALLW